MQQQIWGEVVDFNLAFFLFIWECNSENIIKIGPYLPKFLQEKFGTVFLAHPVGELVTYSKPMRLVNVWKDVKGFCYGRRL